MKYLLNCLFWVVCCLCLATTASATSCVPDVDVTFGIDKTYIKSTKDLSNIVYEDCNGKKTKLDNLSGKTYTLNFLPTKVWVKSGCNSSNDGPGYGEKFVNPKDVCKPVCPTDPRQYVTTTTITKYDDVSKNFCIKFKSTREDCPVDVGVASYMKFDDKTLTTQVLFDSATATLKKEVTICADVPACAAQLDWFHGPVLKDLKTEIYGVRLFGAYHTNTGTNALSSNYWKTPAHCTVDCAGTPDGGKVDDECGVCGGDGSTCAPTTVCRGGQTITIPKSQVNANDTIGECKETVCRDGQTVTVDQSQVQPFDVPGECNVTVCRQGMTIKVPESQVTQTDTAGECKITVCRDGKTVQIPQSQVTIGEKLGECIKLPPTDPPIDICPTQNQCEDECTEFYGDNKEMVAKCSKLCYKNCGNFCKEGKDCAYEPLKPKACSEANAFLNQVNVATIVNLSMADMEFEFSYTDFFGNEKANFPVLVKSNSKFDVIVNDHGLEFDTYGTVCIESPVKSDGLWTGGVTQYKPIKDWSTFEFAVYYPFENPKKGIQIAPVNAFNLDASGVANWVRITDAYTDGCALTGKLYIYQSNSRTLLKHTYDVTIPDGGRFDYDAHSYVEKDHTGLAVFVPDLQNNKSPQFYFTSARYFYDCDASLHSPFACNDFLTAFATPSREPMKGVSYTGVSTVDGYNTVIELNNPVGNWSSVDIKIFDQKGKVVSDEKIVIAPFATSHFTVNTVLPNQVGFARVSSASFVSASAVSYLFNADGGLSYGFATPFNKVVTTGTQLLEFNSFLTQDNFVEVYNTSTQARNVKMDITDYKGDNLGELNFTLDAEKAARVKLPVDADTYGIVAVHGDDIVVRNYVTKAGEYVVPFIGK